MHIFVRKLQSKPGMLPEIIRRASEGFAPIVREEPGFRHFYLARLTEDEGVTITIFDTKEQIEAANAKGFEFASKMLAPLAAGPLTVIAAGEIMHEEDAKDKARPDAPRILRERAEALLKKLGDISRKA